VSVLQSHGSPFAAMGSALLLAARNGVYGLAMSPVLRGSRVRRLIAAQLVIDESTAMALARTDGRARVQAFWATGLGVYVFWNAGTLIGALVGDRLGDPKSLGLDAAFPAGFVALLVPHLAKRGGRGAALLGCELHRTRRGRPTFFGHCDGKFACGVCRAHIGCRDGGYKIRSECAVERLAFVVWRVVR
jgi:predicted branched-subunit amino acid permease